MWHYPFRFPEYHSSDNRGPFHMGSCTRSSFEEMLTSELYTTHSQQPLGLGKSFCLEPSEPYRSPE
ncbi:hypothetical protein CDL15_Pgr012474 [Punica granatum]|uniref:Uncharacterized protein n=1 Tax=Punica granatum TaxID=22663 RepID=A0A218X0B5_PUNGR|nr:hypothetical protein CDL15_Pgr012474 [Punica granatum]